MKRATISSRVAISLGVVLLVVGATSVYFIGRSGVTTKTVTTASNSYFTISDCTISAEGAVQIRVISDSNGQIINDAKLNGTLFNQCGNWYTDQFVPQGGGWFSPALSTTVIGVFTVSIQ